MIREAYNKNDL